MADYKPTPPPWNAPYVLADDWNPQKPTRINIFAGGKRIHTVNLNQELDVPYQEALANAYLFAASHAMADAIRAVLSAPDEEAMAKCRAALGLTIPPPDAGKPKVA